jgi:hypothetical protein
MGESTHSSDKKYGNAVYLKVEVDENHIKVKI